MANVCHICSGAENLRGRICRKCKYEREKVRAGNTCEVCGVLVFRGPRCTACGCGRKRIYTDPVARAKERRRERHAADPVSAEKYRDAKRRAFLRYSARHPEKIKERGLVTADRFAAKRSMSRLAVLRPMNLEPLSAVWRSAVRLRLSKPPRFTPEEFAERRKIRARLKNLHKRARRMSAGGRAKVSDIVWLKDQQRSRCFYCLKKLSDKYHVDHFVPIARGGRTDRQNLRLACAPCNLAKGDKLPEQFLGTLVA